ncbi:diacylglycerol kinase family protein [Eggerthellaceae bacterium 24-137]
MPTSPSSPRGPLALIANPAAQNGRGAWAAVEAASLLSARVGDQGFRLLLTEGPRHATEIVSQLPSETAAVVALGGDGLVNEVACGLMARPAADRPPLGVLPAGSGNDYAATLGMASGLSRAIDQILQFRTVPADVGRVNGRYFVETLSFGLDAAIALDTVKRRVRTGGAGTRLYLESAIDQLFHHLDVYRFQATLEGPMPTCGEPFGGRGSAAEPTHRIVEGDAYLFAVQIGQTYGGGFRITPDASIDDGLFDVCWASPTLGSWKALALLLAAKGGRHTGNSHIHMERTRSLVLEFPVEPPAQLDGEKLEGTRFEIDCLPRAITVIRGQ